MGSVIPLFGAGMAELCPHYGIKFRYFRKARVRSGDSGMKFRYFDAHARVSSLLVCLSCLHCLLHCRVNAMPVA